MLLRARVIGLLWIVVMASGALCWAADLTVVVEGVRNDSGDVLLSVYGSQNQWPDGNAVADETEAASRGRVTFTIKDLSPGTYAISAFHDENGNGKLDMNFFGFPLEGFAFSNDARPVLSAPSFRAAAVRLGDGDQTISMHMQYLGTN